MEFFTETSQIDSSSTLDIDNSEPETAVFSSSSAILTADHAKINNTSSSTKIRIPPTLDPPHQFHRLSRSNSSNSLSAILGDRRGIVKREISKEGVHSAQEFINSNPFFNSSKAHIEHLSLLASSRAPHLHFNQSRQLQSLQQSNISLASSHPYLSHSTPMVPLVASAAFGSWQSIDDCFSNAPPVPPIATSSATHRRPPHPLVQIESAAIGVKEDLVVDNSLSTPVGADSTAATNSMSSSSASQHPNTEYLDDDILHAANLLFNTFNHAKYFYNSSLRVSSSSSPCLSSAITSSSTNRAPSPSLFIKQKPTSIGNRRSSSASANKTSVTRMKIKKTSRTADVSSSESEDVSVNDSHDDEYTSTSTKRVRINVQRSSTSYKRVAGTSNSTPARHSASNSPKKRGGSSSSTRSTAAIVAAAASGKVAREETPPSVSVQSTQSLIVTGNRRSRDSVAAAKLSSSISGTPPYESASVIAALKAKRSNGGGSGVEGCNSHKKNKPATGNSARSGSATSISSTTLATQNPSLPSSQRGSISSSASSNSSTTNSSNHEVAKAIPGKVCGYCAATITPMWRHGPPSCPDLCNKCGVKYMRGRLSLYC